MGGAAPDALINGGDVAYKKENHYYVLRDNSLIGTPNEWGTAVVTTAEQYEADTIVIEDNQGGDMVESTLINAGCTVPIQRVRAVKSKQARAMTASMLCEQGRIHFYRDTSAYHKEHGRDNLDVLEDELCNWLPGHDSPDRMDAFVHGINYLQPDMKDTGTEMSARAAAAQLFGSYYGG